MFNLQAAVTTVFLMAMFLCVYIGWLFVMFNRWWPARLFGGLVVILAFTGIVSHVAALVVGA